MTASLFELPIYFKADRPASTQDRQVKHVARASLGLIRRHTWYGVKLIGDEEALLTAMIDLAGRFELGRLRPRVGSTLAKVH